MAESTPTSPPVTTQIVTTQIVTTQSGDLLGVRVNDQIELFRGIPYARPPVGELRWKPPQAPEAWQTVRHASEFSASCIQPTNSSGYVWRRGEFSISEDCLYLNVWTQSSRQSNPVMVWFHGGAHTSGQGHAAIFDGTRLAEEGVVVVTINYRLGAFGFLAHPWLSDESDHDSSGNYGLLDKIAALNWVRDNIAQFGGDPDNVTIFGQSAGSQSVCSLTTSPLSRGLFHKAIGQSAACVGPAPKSDVAGLERGGRLVDALQVTSLGELRNVSPGEILGATESSGWAAGSRIVIDGWVLPEPHIDTFRKGQQAQVPLMVGCLADEGVNLFPVNETLTDSELDGYLDRTLGSMAKAVKAAYASGSEQTPGQVQHAIATDLFMAFAMRRWAEYQAETGQPTYLYFMDHIPPAFHLYMPESPQLDLPGGPRQAAYHSGDLAFVFGNVGKVGVNWNDEDRALSNLMVQYWTNFAKYGDPNSTEPTRLPVWQAFDNDQFSTLRLNTSPASVPGIRRDRLDQLAQAQPR